MSSLTITAEVMVGTSIETACKDMIKLCRVIACSVEVNFNGVSIFTNGYGSAKEGAEAYQKELKKPVDKQMVAIF